MKITRYDGPAALAVQGDLERVYLEAFAESPYCKTPEDVTRTFARFERQAGRPGFRAVLARVGDEPAGMAYGHPLPATTGWWSTLITPVSDAMSKEDGTRTFGLFELAVSPVHRRRHIATRLHTALLDGIAQQRVILNTRPEASAAQLAYHHWGYRKIGENHPWEGAALHDLLLLDLSNRALAEGEESHGGPAR